MVILYKMRIIIIHVSIFIPFFIKIDFLLLLRISGRTFVEVNLHRMRGETDWSSRNYMGDIKTKL